MANLTNPVATLAGFAIKHTTHGLQKSSQELATGIRSVEGNLVGFVVGSSLRSSEMVLKAVSSSSGYAINLLSVAENALTNGRDLLLEMRALIAQANTADGGVLIELDQLYQDAINNFNRLFRESIFDSRKLFDNANAAQAAFALGNATADAINLGIRVGEKITDTITITTPELVFSTNFAHAITADIAGVGGAPYAAGDTGALVGIAPGAAGAPFTAAGINLAGIVSDAANVIVGSVQNLLLATLAGGGANATYIAATSQENQAVADSMVIAMMNIVVKGLNNVVGQKEAIRSAANNLDDLITVVNSGADSYLLTEYEESSKRFQAELLSLQGAISTIAQGARVASATLDLIKGQ